MTADQAYDWLAPKVSDAERSALDVIMAAARTPEQGGEMREVMKDWLKFSDDVVPSCAAGDDWLGDLQVRTRALLAREERMK